MGEAEITKERPCTCSTNSILIKFEIWSKFTVFSFKMWSADHDKILYMSWEFYCRDMCKISLWSAECILNRKYRTVNFHRISNLWHVQNFVLIVWIYNEQHYKFNWLLNSIEISLVGWAPGLWFALLTNIIPKSWSALIKWFEAFKDFLFSPTPYPHQG